MGPRAGRKGNLSDFTKIKPNECCDMSDTILWHGGINWQCSYIGYSVAGVSATSRKSAGSISDVVFGVFLLN